MRKKFITFIVAGLLIISLAACGENQTSDKTENSSEEQSKDLTFADLAKMVLLRGRSMIRRWDMERCEKLIGYLNEPVTCP